MRHLQLHEVLAQGRSVGFLKAMFTWSSYLCCRLHCFPSCQVVYEIPSPGPTARLEMLKYHGRNKPVEDDNLYYKVAEVTAGWSAAALANLMNEAAILTVGGAMRSVVTCWRCWC